MAFPTGSTTNRGCGEFPRRRARLDVMRKLLGAVATIVLGLISLAPVALAESPLDVAEELADDGVFVARARTDIDEESLASAIQQARFDGLRIVAVAPIDPQPSGSAFARRIQEVVDADAALVFLEEEPLETFVVDELSGGHIRAQQRARAVNDPGRAVLTFAQELTAEREPSRPALIRQLMLLALLLAAVVGAAMVFENLVGDAKAFFWRRMAARRSTSAASRDNKHISNDPERPDSDDLMADSGHGRSDH